MQFSCIQRPEVNSLGALENTGASVEPYSSALAICSDLDETPGAETYFELIRFLTTTEETSMGTGVGLEIGNSIYFDMPTGHFSYWNTTDQNRETIRALIRSGHIDCLHSYGDLATTRAHAGRALEELARHECYLKVWVDHSKAPTNLGADIMKGHGDDPKHPAYHTDLTLAYGIKYVWRGRVTSVIGQNRPPCLSGIANWQHPFKSLKTIFKEKSKQTLAGCGNAKYGIHGQNRVMKRVHLRDGHSQVFEFLRCNPHWGGVSCGDRGDRIHEVLTKRFLDRLVQRKAVCILYTHLGKSDLRQDRPGFKPEVVRAFRLLAEYVRAGKILVATTSRLLDRLAAQEI